MAKKSDKGRRRRVSATEANRAFSDVLDQVERGRRFLIHRRGRDICVMEPPAVTGRRASQCLAWLRSRAPVVLDDRFTGDLRDVLAGEPPEARRPWDS